MMETGTKKCGKNCNRDMKETGNAQLVEEFMVAENAKLEKHMLMGIFMLKIPLVVGNILS